MSNIFTTKEQLENAIDLWINNESLATSNYGNINTWDVSAITSFAALFKDKPNFNSGIPDKNDFI